MNQKQFLAIAGILGLLLSMMLWSPVKASFSTQSEPTNTLMATVTGTPINSYIIVRRDTDNPQINVRSGPHSSYERIGVLQMLEEAPALGRTDGGDWILISYPSAPGGIGWVYSPLVIVQGDPLPIVEPPPTPTLAVTNTIDPTLAAQFIVTAVPTRLPTFTPPAPLVIPTFVDASTSSTVGNIPVGLIIIILLAVGLITSLVAFIQSR